ncbi:TadE/TadG family type IV pilus assembly protein [Pontixanthobacter sp.]|uniref:TadE/TadG family type IV pilus assembly protein n=1 Tax=Pontixanthobacter sp. TaxID=2792078 RepID=UPI003C7D9612
MPSKPTHLKPAKQGGTGCLNVLYNTRGNVMPMAAIGMIAMAGMVGGGVDISRAYMVQNRLQNACDSGVLAGRRAVDENGYTTTAQTQAEDYFYTNFDQKIEGAKSTTFVTTATENNNRIDGLATTKLDTAVMSLFGFDEIDISADCTASMSVGNSDVMMVLDTTGSMVTSLPGSGGTRIQALREAMKGFYDTVETASSGSNARIRYGFVPYSSSINVGRLLFNENPSFLADSVTVQSRVPQYHEVDVKEVAGWEDPVIRYDDSTGPIQTNPWTEFSGPHRNRRECNRDERPADSSWTRSGSKTSDTVEYRDSAGRKVIKTSVTENEVQTRYRCRRAGGRWYVESQIRERPRISEEYAISEPVYVTVRKTQFSRYKYKEASFPTTAYKSFSSATTLTGDGGTNETWTWNGCIEERKTVAADKFSWSSLTGMNPSGALDLDIDAVPDPSDPDTQWKPMWEGIAYLRRSSSSGFNWSSSPETDFGYKTFSTCPQEAQLLDEMTKVDFDTYADSLSTGGSTYHDLGMIWGARLASPTGIFQDNVTEIPANGGSVARHIIFMTDGDMFPNNVLHTSYGVERYDQRVTGDGSSNQTSRHTSRFLAVCQATKAKGIRVWVIAFASSLTSDLDECASDDSSFLASNAAQLNAAFQEIAKDVGELRVTQ